MTGPESNHTTSTHTDEAPVRLRVTTVAGLGVVSIALFVIAWSMNSPWASVPAAFAFLLVSIAFQDGCQVVRQWRRRTDERPS